MGDGEQKNPVLAATPELTNSCGSPTPAPGKTPGISLGGTQEAALLSPVEPSAAGIPASLKNPFCQKSKPLTMILFYSASVRKPQTLRKERKKPKEDAADVHLLLQSQPSILSGFCLTYAAKGTHLSPFWIFVALGTMPKALSAQEDCSVEAAREQVPSSSWGSCCWSWRIQMLAAV